MKYEKGDKFIIEIKSKLANGLYKIKGFNTLVFDDFGLDMLKQIHEHDGCGGCRFFHSDGYPCIQCRNNYMDKFKPMPEEIQVGDEVVHDGDDTKAVAYQVTDNAVYVLQRNDSVVWSNLLRCEWNKKLCHRTGKTYPELIKALESLPKE